MTGLDHVPYARVPVWAAADEGLSKMGLRVLIALCRFVDQDGRCWPAQTTIAEACGVARRQSVNEAIQELIERGYLFADSTRRRTAGTFQTASYVVAYKAPVNLQVMSKTRARARLKIDQKKRNRVHPAPDTVSDTTGTNQEHRVHPGGDMDRVHPAPDITVSTPGGTQTAHVNYPKNQLPTRGAVEPKTVPSPAEQEVAYFSPIECSRVLPYLKTAMGRLKWSRFHLAARLDLTQAELKRLEDQNITLDRDTADLLIGKLRDLLHGTGWHEMGVDPEPDPDTRKPLPAAEAPASSAPMARQGQQRKSSPGQSTMLLPIPGGSAGLQRTQWEDDACERGMSIILEWIRHDRDDVRELILMTFWQMPEAEQRRIKIDISRKRLLMRDFLTRIHAAADEQDLARAAG